MVEHDVGELPAGVVAVGPRPVGVGDPGRVVVDGPAQAHAGADGGRRQRRVQLVDHLQAGRLDDVALEGGRGEDQGQPRPADTALGSAELELGGEAENPTRLEDAAHLVGGVGHVEQLAHVLDRPRREDAVEGVVGVAEEAGVHVLGHQAGAVEVEAGQHGGVDEHGHRRHRGPRPGLHVTVGGEDLAAVPGQVEEGVLQARGHAQDHRVGVEGAVVAQGPHRHGHFPVLAVLGAGGEVGEQVELVGADVADDGRQFLVFEVGEVAELVEVHRGPARARTAGVSTRPPASAEGDGTARPVTEAMTSR